MAVFRPMGIRNGLQATGGVQPGDLLVGGESVTPGAITTVGAGIWTAAAIASGIITRSGPVGGYTDTTDTATNILNALAGAAPAADVVPGTSWRMLFLNTVAQALTFAAGVGVRSGAGTLTVAASLWREYLWTVLNNLGPYTLTCVTTNGSAVVTFTLPSGQTGFPIGPAVNAVNIGPGMTVSGTGVTAGTRILSVQTGAGGVTGFTMDANATATGSASLLLSPTLQIDSLRSGTA